MKVKILFFALMVSLISCEKVKDMELFDKKEKPCATVNSESMSQDIIKNFNDKYRGASNVVWFNKDEKAFVAVFTFNSKETKATYTKEGNFVKEEVDQDDEENDDDDKGCSCDTEEDDKD